MNSAWQYAAPVRIPTSWNSAVTTHAVPSFGAADARGPGYLQVARRHRFQLAGTGDWCQRWRQGCTGAPWWLVGNPEARLCSSDLESDIKSTTLGQTGLHVVRIAFGTWQLGGEWGHFDEHAAITAIGRARELGVNFFDTAHAYGFGTSEHILGKSTSRRAHQCAGRTRDIDKIMTSATPMAGPSPEGMP
jgi:hypothetical protein